MIPLVSACLLFLWCWFAPGCLLAATWYVDNSVASNGNGTSWASAWKNLSNIVWGSVHAGDTVMISGGSPSQTYTESLTIGASGGSAGQPITITGSGDVGHNGTVILDGQLTLSTGVILRNVSNVTIQNLTVQNYNASGGQINVTESTNILITNTHTICCLSSAHAGIGLQRSANITIRGNLMTTPSDGGVNAQSDGIYSQQNTGGNVFENNTILISDTNTSGHDDCIQSYQDGPTTIRGNYCEHSDTKTTNSQGFIIADTIGTTTVYNNVIYGPNSYNAMLYYLNETGFTGALLAYNNTLVGGKFQTLRFQNAPNAIAINNIIMSTQANAVLTQVTNGFPTVNIHHNLYYAPNSTQPFYVAVSPNETTGTGYTWSQWQALGYAANSLNANPLLRSIALSPKGDFHLQSGSPAMNAGVMMPGLAYNGPAPDLGALESGTRGQVPAPTKLRLLVVP